MKKSFSLVVFLLMMNAPRAFAECQPVPGAAQLWSRPSIHWVWLGETHGTAETPAVFGDMVCDALAHGRHVTVALERPTTEQAAIDAVVGAGDRRAAQQLLLSQEDWRSVFDGRTSQSMLELLFHLRDLKAQYPALRVVAIVDPSAFATSSAANNEAMGHSVLALDGKDPKDLVLVLTGNIHGMKNTIFGYKPAAMYLPADRLISLQVTDAGGQAWTESDRGCGASLAGIPDKDKSRSFGIYLDSSLARFGMVDGILTLGKPTTASSPANATELATAPCRQMFLSQQQKQGR